MNTENVVRHLRALWRTDRIIADIRLRHLLMGLGLRAFAALIAAFGLLMLELSAYFALVQIWTAISAAAILGVINFAIAAVLFVIASKPPSGRELELATEIHGTSIDALQLEARALQSELSGMIHNPLNEILPLLHAVKSGAGIGCLPAIAAEDDPDLMPLPPGIIGKPEIFLITHRDLRGRARVRVVFDFIVRLCAERAPELAGVAIAERLGDRSVHS